MKNYSVTIDGDMPESAKILTLKAKNENGDIAELNIHQLEHVQKNIWTAERVDWWHWTK